MAKAAKRVPNGFNTVTAHLMLDNAVPASLWLYVDNSDALFNRAVGAGAKVQVPLGDQFWG